MKYDFDILIIGAGSAGIAAAEFAVQFGKKVAIVTRDRIGGDCLWTGCVPSKSLIHVARQCYESKDKSRGSDFFERSKKHIVAAQNVIRDAHDSVEYFTALGVETIVGAASFVDAHTVTVGERIVRAKFILLATGSRPVVPDIAGLSDISYFTNETIFEIEKLPKSLVIVGGGPIGCELAQAFSRFGCVVSVIQRNERLLPKDEPDASALILEQFHNEGIIVYRNSQIQMVQKDEQGIVVQIDEKGSLREVRGEVLLLCVGRMATTEGLNLEKVGVKFSQKGILHGSELQTTQRNIYVAGDVAGDYVFTHFAARQAVAAVQNMIFPFDSDFAPKTVPWVTFTEPEVAAVGIREEQKGVRCINFPYSAIDRAIAEDTTTGFIHLYVNSRDRIIGAEIVGARAGELIHEICLAIECDASIGKVMGMIHAYPTYSSGIQQALFADFSLRTSLKKRIGRFLSRFT
jgi:pyruvate/2-oxoglutarate dehydrogenase complex dihydrolipoamide dehydrogenase (E3) component